MLIIRKGVYGASESFKARRYTYHIKSKSKINVTWKTINEQPDNHFHTIEYSTAEFICNVGSYFHILQVYGQRAINRFILLPFIETLLRKEFPQSYSPEKENQD